LIAFTQWSTLMAFPVGSVYASLANWHATGLQ